MGHLYCITFSPRLRNHRGREEANIVRAREGRWFQRNGVLQKQHGSSTYELTAVTVVWIRPEQSQPRQKKKTSLWTRKGVLKPYYPSLRDIDTWWILGKGSKLLHGCSPQEASHDPEDGPIPLCTYEILHLFIFRMTRYWVEDAGFMSVLGMPSS